MVLRFISADENDNAAVCDKTSGAKGLLRPLLLTSQEQVFRCTGQEKITFAMHCRRNEGKQKRFLSTKKLTLYRMPEGDFPVSAVFPLFQLLCAFFGTQWVVDAAMYQ